MNTNYENLEKHLRLLDVRNNRMETDNILGININKYFMPSVANIVGTDLRNYKLISRNMFACNPMHVGRDEKLPVALYLHEDKAIISPAYFMFDIVDENKLLPDYLMMWFRRPEFDRTCWLKTDGSVRGGITWEDICHLEILIPPMEKQRKIIKAYQTIIDRINLKQRINDNLEAIALTLFKSFFITKEIHQDNKWENKPLYDCASYINGTSFLSDEYSDKGLPIIKITELKDGITEATQYFHGIKDNKYFVHNMDILFSWSGNPDTSIDIFIWHKGNAILNQHTFRIIPSDNANAYTYFLLKYFKPEFAKAAKNKQTTGLGHVTIKDLQRLTVSYCKPLVLEYNKRITPIFDNIYQNLLEINYLERLEMQVIQQISILN